MTEETFLTTGEVAKLLRYRSPSHVANLCKAGKLPAVQIAGKWLIDRQKLIAQLDNSGHTTNEKSPRAKRYVAKGVSDKIKALA